MKALFLAVLIIACANAANLNPAPSDLLGTWNYVSTTCPNSPYECSSGAKFVQTGNTTLNMTVMALDTPNCLNGTSYVYEFMNVALNETLTSNSAFNFALEFESSDSDLEFSISNVDDKLTLTLIETQMSPVCNVTFSKSANFLKATITVIMATIATMFI